LICCSAETHEQWDVTAAGHVGSGCQRVLGRRVNMSGLISSVKHVRYAMGSLTAVLFSAAVGASL
jgi:hypothetical protein